MSVKEMLKDLQALQQIDMAILELQRAGEAHPKRLAELDAQLATARAAVEAERARLAENERQRSARQSEITAEKDKIKKWEARLAEQRTTREYAALAREIDIAKKSVLNLDEELKASAGTTEDIRRALADKEAALRRQEDASAAERSQLSASIASLASQVQALDEKRTVAFKSVDPTFGARYDAIRKKKRSSGLAPVVNGICRGCNMRIPPQLHNILRSGATIESCPNCQRLIFDEEALGNGAR